jgi:hypothetical protein
MSLFCKQLNRGENKPHYEGNVPEKMQFLSITNPLFKVGEQVGMQDTPWNSNHRLDSMGKVHQTYTNGYCIIKRKWYWKPVLLG